VSDGAAVSTTYAVLDVNPADALAVVYVDGEHVGDQDGSQTQPYRLVESGSLAVAPDGLVRIASGAYGESLRLGTGGKGLRLERFDSGGVVRIGASGGGAKALDTGDAFRQSLVDALTRQVASDAWMGMGGVSGAADGESAARIWPEGHTYEPILPRWQVLPGLHSAAPSDDFFIRMRHVSAQALAGLSVSVAPEPGGGAWWVLKAAHGGAEDWWLQIAPQGLWTPGTVVEPGIAWRGDAADAVDVDPAAFFIRDGEANDAATLVWQPQPGADYDATGLADADAASAVVREAAAPEGLGALPGAIGPVYEIGPDQVFDAPQRVWLPLPAGIDPAAAQLYYAKPHGSDRGWYPAAHVEGWLVPGSERTLTLDGTTHLGLRIRHAATCQWATAEGAE